MHDFRPLFLLHNHSTRVKAQTNRTHTTIPPLSSNQDVARLFRPKIVRTHADEGCGQHPRHTIHTAAATTAAVDRRFSALRTARCLLSMHARYLHVRGPTWHPPPPSRRPMEINCGWGEGGGQEIYHTFRRKKIRGELRGCHGSKNRTHKIRAIRRGAK